jgi:hypothetical protein
MKRGRKPNKAKAAKIETITESIPTNNTVLKDSPKEVITGVDNEAQDRDIELVNSVSEKKVSKASQIFWKFNKVGYQQDSAEDYEAALGKMIMLDLQRECVRAGLRPLDRRDLMITRLVREFSKTKLATGEHLQSKQKPSSSKVKDIISKIF